MDPLSSNVARGPVSATASLHPSCMAWRLLMSGNYRDPYLWTELHPCKIPQHPWCSAISHKFSAVSEKQTLAFIAQKHEFSTHLHGTWLLFICLVYCMLLTPSSCSHNSDNTENGNCSLTCFIVLSDRVLVWRALYAEVISVSAYLCYRSLSRICALLWPFLVNTDVICT